MCSKDVFGVLPVSIRAPCYTIDDPAVDGFLLDPHVDPAGAPSEPKDDAMACMASSLNTPLDTDYDIGGLTSVLRRP